MMHDDNKILRDYNLEVIQGIECLPLVKGLPRKRILCELKWCNVEEESCIILAVCNVLLAV